MLWAFGIAALLLSSGAARADCSSRWTEPLEGAVLRVAHYPTHRELLAAFDLRSVPGARELTSMRFVLRDAAGRELQTWRASVESARGDGGLRQWLTLPELADGRYVVTTSLEAGAACSGLVGPSAQFERKRFGWEGNTLGREPVVIPPFTPLRVRGRRVHAVLRTYELGPTGLIDQVEVEGQPLLAGPMRLEATIDGIAVSPLARVTAVVRRSADDRVDVSSGISLGPLHGALRAHFEIDGLYRIALDLDGPASARIGALDLVIPLRAERTTLLNAITDMAHHHTLGALPAGRGRVWDALQVGRSELPQGFVPYTWLGDEERGLAWMAGSGRDFWFFPGRPMAEIRRSGSAVEIVIHFANRPALFARARHLEFALQATPVKPRPADWRQWQLICDAPAGFIAICPLATGWYWGAESAYGHYRPRGNDYSFLERLAGLRRGGTLGPLAGDRWLEARGANHGASWPMVRDSLRWAVNSLAKRPRAAVAYVNPHNVAWTPEFRAYADEWRLAPFGDPAGRDAVDDQQLEVTPAASFRDFALSQMDRLLATGAVDGFFLDNTFLRASWDERHGSAWRDLEGRLQPGVDLFELREFMRRAQTLVWARRGEWWNVAHGTTTPISAVQGWAGVILDGEWRYGAQDYQERFARDLMRASSLGVQVGAAPVYLSGTRGADAPRSRELSRSLAGVTALHEIRVMEEAKASPHEFWKRLRAFGYGDPRCAVHRYWDRPKRFEVIGAAAEALVVTCRQSALALVVNYGGAGRAELAFDTSALGIAARGECIDPEGGGPIESIGESCRFAIARNGVRWIERREARAR